MKVSIRSRATSLSRTGRRAPDPFADSQRGQGLSRSSPHGAALQLLADRSERTEHLASLQLLTRGTGRTRAATTAQALADRSEAASLRQVAHEGVARRGSSLPFADTIQRSFGHHDTSTIETFGDGRASAACETLGAKAYATGNKIAFAGKPSLHTAAHEAAHVIQQRSGVQLSGGVGEAGDRYERQADAVADAVTQGRSAEALLDQQTAGSSQRSVSTDAPVQRELAVLDQTEDSEVQLDTFLDSVGLELNNDQKRSVLLLQKSARRYVFPIPKSSTSDHKAAFLSWLAENEMIETSPGDVELASGSISLKKMYKSSGKKFTDVNMGAYQVMTPDNKKMIGTTGLSTCVGLVVAGKTAKGWVAGVHHLPGGTGDIVKAYEKLKGMVYAAAEAYGGISNLKRYAIPGDSTHEEIITPFEKKYGEFNNDWRALLAGYGKGTHSIAVTFERFWKWHAPDGLRVKYWKVAS